MSYIEKLKSRPLSRKIFLIGSVVTFIGFFLPIINYTTGKSLFAKNQPFSTELNDIIEKEVRVRKVHCKEAYEVQVGEEKVLVEKEVDAINGNLVMNKSTDVSLKKTTETVEEVRPIMETRYRDVYRIITDTRVSLPKSSYNKAKIEVINGLDSALADKLSADKPFDQKITNGITVEVAPFQDLYDKIAELDKNAPDYQEKFAPLEKEWNNKYKDEIKQYSEELSDAEYKRIVTLAENKQQNDYFDLGYASTPLTVRYSTSNIFSTATFFNRKFFAYNATFFVALWLCSIAGICVFCICRSLVADVIVWLIGAGFGIAAIVGVTGFFKEICSTPAKVITVAPVLDFASVGLYVVLIGWLIALVGVVISVATVKKAEIRKEI